MVPGSRNAGAQTQPAGTTAAVSPPASDKNAAEMTSRETPATFKARVNLVLVPVVVRDGKGLAVGNLQKEDFQLFDKGKVQVISRFSVEKAGGTASGNEKSNEKSPDTNAPPKPDGEAAPLTIPDRYVAYLFDDVHLEFGDLSRVRDATDRHFASLEPSARAAILTTSGQTTLDFTDDRAKLHETLLRLQPRPISRSGGADCPHVTYYMADLIQNKNDPQALQAAAEDAIVCMHLDTSSPGTVQMAAQSAQMAASMALNNGDHETRISLNVLREAVRRMAAMPGQRNLVLISPGFFAPNDLIEFKTEVIDRALHANVVISALDARGLYAIVPGGDASQAAIPGSSISQGLRMQYQTTSAMIESDVMAELAEGTGGTFFHNSNDLAEGLRRVAARPEVYYILGFSPQNLKLDGTFHKLKVTLKDPSRVNLQARRGYFAPRHTADAAEEAKQEIEEALFSREEMHDLPVELHTQFFKISDISARLSVLARVDLKQIRFRKVDGRNRNDLTVASGLFDRNGNFISGSEKTIEMRLKDETLGTKLNAPITVRTNFDVKPGTYVVRLVVRDTEGQLMSAANGAVEIP